MWSFVVFCRLFEAFGGKGGQARGTHGIGASSAGVRRLGRIGIAGRNTNVAGIVPAPVEDRDGRFQTAARGTFRRRLRAQFKPSPMKEQLENKVKTWHSLGLRSAGKAIGRVSGRAGPPARRSSGIQVKLLREKTLHIRLLGDG